MNDNVGMAYQKDDDKQPDVEFVRQCVDAFVKKFGYIPTDMWMSKAVDSSDVFPIPFTQVDYVPVGTFVLYPVVKKRVPMLPIKERFPI